MLYADLRDFTMYYVKWYDDHGNSGRMSFGYNNDWAIDFKAVMLHLIPGLIVFIGKNS